MWPTGRSGLDYIRLLAYTARGKGVLQGEPVVRHV
jgi:hypothetical protein